MDRSLSKPVELVINRKSHAAVRGCKELSTTELTEHIYVLKIAKFLYFWPIRYGMGDLFLNSGAELHVPYI